jgi:hypothetical protein
VWVKLCNENRSKKDDGVFFTIVNKLFFYRRFSINNVTMTTVGARHFGRHRRHVGGNGSFIVTKFYYKRSLYVEVIFTKLSNAIRNGHRRNPRAPT